MHRVSDQLQDRHPCMDPAFKDSYNPKEVSRAFGARTIPKYAELLVMDELQDSERVKALQELYELLSNQETKCTAVAHELMFSCADLTESRSTEVRTNAALVISSLVLHQSDQVDELSNDTMLKAATALLSDNEEPVICAACTIFRNLTISNEVILQLASKENVIQKITSMLTTQPIKAIPTAVLELLLEILANVTRVYEGARACGHYSIITPVLQVLKQPVLYRPETILHAVLVISNAAMHDQNKQEVVRQETVEICLKVLTKTLNHGLKCDAKMEDELTRSLLGAIMGLSTCEDAKPRVIEFGVEPLVRCLKHANPSIKKNAVLTVNYACESPLGITQFTQRLLHDKALLVEVLDIKAIPALNKSLAPFVDEDDKLCALQTVNELCQTEAGVNQVVQTLNMLDNLLQLVTDSQSELQQSAVQILQLMASFGSTYIKRIGKKMIKLQLPDHEFSRILKLSIADFEQQYL